MIKTLALTKPHCDVVDTVELVLIGLKVKKSGTSILVQKKSEK